MTQKMNEAVIRDKFNQTGCELLDTYKNNNIPMKFRCNCGRISTISYKSFRRGSRCLGCSGKQKHTLQEIKEQIEAAGYLLLSEQYKGASTKMQVRCPVGHTYATHWNNFQQGRRCPTCSAEENFAALRLKHEEVAERFSQGGCELLSTEYKSNQQKLKYKCSCGSISWTTLGNFGEGHRCERCGLEKMTGPNHPGWIKDREEAKLRKTMRTKCVSVVKNTFKSLGIHKNNQSYKLIGYTSRELRQRVTSHPNWEHVKNGKWHLDHIFPIKAFCDYKIRDISLINCLENLRPLKGKENVKKGSTYNKDDFEFWLSTKGYT